MSAVLKVAALGNYQAAEVPRRIPLNTTDSLATITTAGYLNSIADRQQFLASDIIDAYYDTGLHGQFGLSIDSAGVITMAALSNPGEVTAIGAVVAGNVPMFDGTSGDVEDSDIAASALATFAGATTIGNLPKFSSVLGEVEDSVVVAANVLETTTDVTDYQQIVGINEILIASVGTWTRTRVAQGNYVLRHTVADDTSVIGIDITPAIRAAAGRGFRLASIDVIYSVAALALDAHSIVLDRIAYANNVAVAITSVPLTGSLATATQAQPYLSNVTVTTPAFNVTANSKYVAELTVNAGATSEYDFYGLNLHFTKSVA